MNTVVTICCRCCLVLEMVLLNEGVSGTGAYVENVADHWRARPACAGASFGTTHPWPVDRATFAAFRTVGVR